MTGLKFCAKLGALQLHSSHGCYSREQKNLQKSGVKSGGNFFWPDPHTFCRSRAKNILESFVKFWKVLESLWKCWTFFEIFGNFWKVSESFGKFWSYILLFYVWSYFLLFYVWSYILLFYVWSYTLLFYALFLYF